MSAIPLGAEVTLHTNEFYLRDNNYQTTSTNPLNGHQEELNMMT